MISVVIPYFNCIEDLNSLLDVSLLDENLVSEILIVDDGSNIPLTEVLNISNPKVRIYTQINQGPGVARRTGLSLVSGDYVHFMDADDQLSTNFYGNFEKYLLQGFDCMCANVEFREIDSGLSRRTTRFNHKADVYSGEEYSALLLQSKVPTFFQNKIFSAVTLQKHLMNDERINEDVSSIWRQILPMKHIKVVDEATLFYVQTSGSIMRSYDFEKNIQRLNSFRWIESTVSGNELKLWHKFRSIYFSNIVLLGALKMQWNAKRFTGLFSLLILLARELEKSSISTPTNISSIKTVAMLPVWFVLKILGRLFT